MSVLGITFQPWGALAIRERRKTVWRGLMNPQPKYPDKADFNSLGDWCWSPPPDDLVGLNDWHSPRHRVGDVCYVKETWRTSCDYDRFSPSRLAVKKSKDVPILYEADQGVCGGWGRYRHALFMPQRFARTWIEIVNVRPERLQAITPADVVLEGFDVGHRNGRDADTEHWELVNKFIRKWDSMHQYSPWKDDPFVWRYQFRLTEAPDA